MTRFKFSIETTVVGYALVQHLKKAHNCSITSIVMFGTYKEVLLFIYQILPRSGTLESKVSEI